MEERRGLSGGRGCRLLGGGVARGDRRFAQRYAELEGEPPRGRFVDVLEVGGRQTEDGGAPGRQPQRRHDHRAGDVLGKERVAPIAAGLGEGLADVVVCGGPGATQRRYEAGQAQRPSPDVGRQRERCALEEQVARFVALYEERAGDAAVCQAVGEPIKRVVGAGGVLERGRQRQ